MINPAAQPQLPIPAQPVVSSEIPEQPIQLSDNDKKTLLSKLDEIWTLGETELKPSRTRRQKIIRAYNCENEKKAKFLDGQTQFKKPLIYIAHESKHSEMHQSIFPKDEELFELIPETDDDKEACEIWKQYINWILDKASFSTFLDDLIKVFLFGEVTAKVYWDDVKKHTRFCVIQPINFVVWPISEEIDRAYCCQRTYKTLAELQKDADALGFQDWQDLKEPDYINNATNNNSATQSSTQKKIGIEIREYWLPQVKIGEQTFTNMIAYVAKAHEGNGKDTLLKFDKNPYGERNPFAYGVLRKNITELNGLENTGHGLCDMAWSVYQTYNYFLNIISESAGLMAKPTHTYNHTASQAFSPASFYLRMGGLIPVDAGTNLQPLATNSIALQQAETFLQYLETSFEVTTGVTKNNQGVLDGATQRTATEQTFAVRAASTRDRLDAKRLNDIIKRVLETVYHLCNERYKVDDAVALQMARVTQNTSYEDPITDLNGQSTGEMQTVNYTADELVQIIREKLPTDKSIVFDINVVAYENAVDKLDKVAKLERAAGLTGQLIQADPSLMALPKMDESLRYLYQNLDIPSSLLRDTDEVEQLRQQQAMQQQQIMMQQQATQQAQMQMQQQGQQQQLEQQSQQADFDNALKLMQVQNAERRPT